MGGRLHRVLAVLSIVAMLPACDDQSGDQDILTGAIAGAFLGYITAEALQADHDWQLVAVLAGAAAGTMVARNRKTNRCAYARGHDRYYIRPCPRHN